MILPATYNSALLLIILSMICWGSWANLFKLSGKWRFELFYYDYSLGLLLAAIVAAYTFGSMGADLSFSDNLLIALRRNMAYAGAAGVGFHLADIVPVGAIIVDAWAYSAHARPVPATAGKASRRKGPGTSPKGIMLSLISGLLMG